MVKRKLFFGIISFVALLSVVISNLYVFGPTANAGVDDAYGTGNGTTIRDYEAAKKYINDLCGNGGYKGSVALAMYPSEVSFNDATGEMKYKANLVWRSCSDKGQDGSRAFAVTGYPSTTGGQPATCPDAGTYAVAHTYDCVKYTDSDLGHLKGYATLGCDAGSGYQCVTGGSSDSGLFKSSIEVIAKEPTYDGKNPNVRGVSGLDGQVPDWSTRTLTSGNWSFYRSSAFCTYYKANNNGASNYTPQGNCIDLTINVSWTRYNYSLTPSITNMDATKDTPVDSASGPYNVDGSVYNNGPTDSKPNTEWQLTKVVYKPSIGISNRSGGDNSADPCTYFAGRACSTSGSAGDVTAYRMDGATNATYAQRASKSYPRTDTITDYDVGTHICYAMSVKPYNHTTGDWRHSQLYCLVVSKSPKVQVLGGDLIVGRGSAFNAAPGTGSEVTTSISSTTSNGYFGSWSEYGILATGVVKGMASGSGYVGGSPTNDLCSETPRKLSILTFANKPATGACAAASIGKYNSNTTAPNIADRFPVTLSTTPLPSTVDIMGGGSGLSGLYTSTNADLTLNSSRPIPKGRSVVINAPNTTVTINGNIQYTTDPLTSISQIPQVVIIAKNIIIADSVSQIDSWLVAVGSGATDGRINTCATIKPRGGFDESSSLTSKLCNTKLTVNGPISTNHLILRRTAGSGTGTAAGDPAEVFNLRADAYIWATGYTPGTGRLPTVSTKEIPPKF